MNYILIISLIIGIILLIFLLLLWFYSKGNQKNTVKTIRMVYKRFKQKNPDSSNREIADMIIEGRYRHFKTKLFTEEQLLEYLAKIEFDWQNEKQFTYTLGSLIWALENKQYSEEFKHGIEFMCDANSKGISIKSLDE